MYNRMTMDQTCNSKDGLEVNIGLSFQYMPNIGSIYHLTRLYVDYNGYKKNLKQRAQSAMRNTCAKYTAQEFQTLRASVQATMLEDVRFLR